MLLVLLVASCVLFCLLFEFWETFATTLLFVPDPSPDIASSIHYAPESNGGNKREGQLKMDAHHRHAAMISTRGATGAADQVTQVSSFKANMTLHDARFLDIVPEAWWGGPTAVMTTLFPSVVLQKIVIVIDYGLRIFCRYRGKEQRQRDHVKQRPV